MAVCLNGFGEDAPVGRFDLKDLVDPLAFYDFVNAIETRATEWFPEWAPWVLLPSDPDTRRLRTMSRYRCLRLETGASRCTSMG